MTWVLFTPLLLAAPAFARPFAQQGTLLDPKVRDLLHEELSGETAKEHVIAITRHHRIQGSRGYHDAAQWLLEKLQAYGFDEEHAYIESFPSNGKTLYQTWQSPSGWDISSAELRMVAPSDSPGGERIVGYPEIAMSVITYSNPGDVTAELIWVGAGTSDADYAGKDVKGKFVLATGYGGAVHRLAVLKYGAAAVVCYLDDERAPDHPDMLQYTGMWPRTEELAKTTFGFNLTNRQGTKLKKLVESGQKVVLHGKVEGIGLEPFVMDVVVAKIDGSERPDEELVFSAHLDHPKESANDDASGSGATLDIARGLKKLVDEKRLPAPKRTLRFLWVPEWNGTMAYLDAHSDVLGPSWGRGGTVLADLNLDMVGENTELLHSKLIVTQSPFSVPNCLDDLMEDALHALDALEVRTPRGSKSELNFRHTPYSGGSDHQMFLDRGVPSVMLAHDPDYTHHTSDDTLDKVDPVELERCEILAAGVAWHLANLSERQALDLAWATAAGANERLDEHARRLRLRVAGAADDARAAQASEAAAALELCGKREDLCLADVLDHYDLRDHAASGALARLIAEQRVGLKAHVDELRHALAAESGATLAAAAPPSAPANTDGARRIQRNTWGPLAFDLQERHLLGERGAWYSSKDCPFADGERRFELVNLANTGANLGEIRALFSAAYEPVEQFAVTRFFEDLAALGVVALDPRPKPAGGSK